MSGVGGVVVAGAGAGAEELEKVGNFSGDRTLRGNFERQVENYGMESEMRMCMGARRSCTGALRVEAGIPLENHHAACCVCPCMSIYDSTRLSHCMIIA